MRKMIGTIAIIVILFLGLFGCESHNIKPFIANWFKSNSDKQVTEKVNEEIDSIKVSSKNKILNVLN